MITLTDTAAAKVKDLLEDEGEPELALRVAVRPGGCAGFSYEMFFDTDVAADDVTADYDGGVKVVVDQLDRLGFDPAVVADDDSPEVTVGFMHCPFRDLAQANPDLVCSLHRGLVDGFVSAVGGGRVTEFRSLVARDPCQVDLMVEEPG